MNWEQFYLLCFIIGFLYSLLTFLAGGIAKTHGGGHAAHGHLPGHGHGPARAHGGVPAWFNPATLAAFLAWFGGAGYLLRRFSGLWAFAALVVAALAGIAGGWIVFWFLARFLPRYDRALDPDDYEMTGVLGRVSSPVREGGVGEMIFVRDGARRSAPIRSEDGRPIEKDIEVVVTRYERGIAYVRRWDELAN